MGGQLSILSTLNQYNVFSLETLRNVALYTECYQWLIHNITEVLNAKLTSIFTNFRTALQVLPILWVLERCFQLGISQFCTNLDLNCLFVTIIVPIVFLWVRYRVSRKKLQY